MKVSIMTRSIFLLTLVSSSVNAVAGVFDKGSTQFSLLLGDGQAFGDNYTIIGIGVGYYAYDGLEIGINLDSWQGGTPKINQLTPETEVSPQNYDPSQ